MTTTAFPTHSLAPQLGALIPDPMDSGFSHMLLASAIELCITESQILIEHVFDQAEIKIRAAVHRHARDDSRKPNEAGVTQALMAIADKRSDVIRVYCEDIRRHLTTVSYIAPSETLPKVSQAPFPRVSEAPKITIERIETELSAARLCQTIAHHCEDNLIELEGFVSALRGCKTVQQGANVFKPELFACGFRKAIDALDLDESVSSIWIQAVSRDLAHGVNQIYASLVRMLDNSGISPASALDQVGGDALLLNIHERVGVMLARPQASPSSGWEFDLGTIENEAQVRQRSNMEMNISNDERVGLLMAVAPHFEEGAGATRFGQALNKSFPGIDVRALRSKLDPRNGMSTSPVMGRVLSKRVMAVLMDNICEDPRILGTVRHELRRLRDPVITIADRDPSVLTNPDHPARAFIETIVSRSMAYVSEEDPGCVAFLSPLRSGITEFHRSDVDRHRGLIALQAQLEVIWNELDTRSTEAESTRTRIMEWVQERNLQAFMVRKDIRAKHRKKLDRLPPFVIEFIEGPWSNLMAMVEIRGQVGPLKTADTEKVLDALISTSDAGWVAVNRPKFAKTIPHLARDLQCGCRFIDWSPESSESMAFFGKLEALHRKLLDGTKDFLDAHKQDSEAAINSLKAIAAANMANPQFSCSEFTTEDNDERDYWLTPAEKKAIAGFSCTQILDIPATEVATELIDQTATQLLAGHDVMSAKTQSDFLNSSPPGEEFRHGGRVLNKNSHREITDVRLLPLNCWVEIKVVDVWQRMKLTWTNSEEGAQVPTLFLFKRGNGDPVTMTYRMLHRAQQDQKIILVLKNRIMSEAMESVFHQVDVPMV